MESDKNQEGIPESLKIRGIPRIAEQMRIGLRCVINDVAWDYISATAWMTSWFGPFGPASIGASAKTATGISAEQKSDANPTELMVSMRSPIAIDEYD